jgi:hypothetical protein
VFALELLATAHFAAGRYADARSVTNETVAPTNDGLPHDIGSSLIRIRANHYAGDAVTAHASLDGALNRYAADRPELFPGVLVMLGRTREAQWMLSSTATRFNEGSLAVASESFWGSFYLGDIEAALIWLGRAIDNREYWLVPMLRCSPILEPIRSEPGYSRAMNQLAAIEAAGTPTRSVAYP